MTPEQAIYITNQVVWYILVAVTVLIMPSLIVGLIVAIIQTVTQVNEQTLSFLPRLLITLITLAFLGHWLLSEFTQLFHFILENLAR